MTLLCGDYLAKGACLIFFLLLPTLFTRQHVIADILGAIVIGEACYRIASIPWVRGCYGRIVSTKHTFISNTKRNSR